MNTCIINEYTPGEYCKSIECKFYREGAFGDECTLCQAFIYYLWLQKQGYRILQLAEKEQ